MSTHMRQTPRPESPNQRQEDAYWKGYDDARDGLIVISIVIFVLGVLAGVIVSKLV